MKNAEEIMRRCVACQKFANKLHAPASKLKTIPLSWAFATWGLDMVGPLKKSSKGGRTHLLVALDKFTKWIEAVPITSSTALTAVNFIKSIIFRFGVPHNIITDNGTNFTATEFKDFCEELGIKINYASVAHPQYNGQVEKANGLVCGGLKKRLLAPLVQAAGNWVDDSPRYYGAYEPRQTPQPSTHLSSWCTGQKQCYPMTSSLGLLESRGTKKKKQRRLYRTTRTRPTKQETQPWRNQKSTKINCAPTKAVACEVDSSIKVI